MSGGPVSEERLTAEERAGLIRAEDRSWSDLENYVAKLRAEARLSVSGLSEQERCPDCGARMRRVCTGVCERDE